MATVRGGVAAVAAAAAAIPQQPTATAAPPPLPTRGRTLAGLGDMAFLLKYYTFSAKIRTLSDFQLRLSTNQQPPSSAEIITTLRYFQQTLIGFLKDFPRDQMYFCEKFSMDPARWASYPNLNYSGLFYAVSNLLEVFPLIATNQTSIGEAILDTLKALMLFLDRDTLEQLPVLLAAQLGILPNELDKQIVHLLADCVFPFSITEETLIKMTVPGVLMLVLQHGTDPCLHTWITEGVMQCSTEVYSDLMQVIAKGTCESRVAAANLLFHYWPFSNPQILHRKTIQYKVHAWSAVACQANNCADKGPSVRRCYDPMICADVADTSPPVFLCKRCADNVLGERKAQLLPQVQPLPASSTTCGRQDCQSQSRLAVAICCSADCIRTHGFVPLRLCQECLQLLHPPTTSTEHLLHHGSGVIWGNAIMWDTVEAVVKLLRETTTFEGAETEGKRPKWLRQLEGGHSMGKEIDKMADERRMLSRFGVWLMAALCPPTELADKKAIGYMMYNVFQWFSTTALLPNDGLGALLEQLKTDFVCDWINMAIRVHDDVFIDTLCPQHDEYDGRPPFEQIKEALSRLLSLMPYDVISLETWTRVIPHWLQLIHDNCTEEDQPELKVLLGKIFEPDLYPVDAVKVFEFVNKRLAGYDYEELFKSLQWLHLLSRLEITISIGMLLDQFCIALKNLPSFYIPPLGDLDLEDDDVSIHVVIIDIIVLQLKLNESTIFDKTAMNERLFGCLACLLQVPLRTSPHECKNPELDGFADCSACQQAVFLQQMLMQIIESVSPKNEVPITTTEDEPYELIEDASSSHPSTLLSPMTAPGTSKAVSPAASFSLQESLQGGLPIQRAAEHSQDIEFVGILPTEEVESEMIQAITLTEGDVGLEHCQVVTTSHVEGLKGSGATPTGLPPLPTIQAEFWDTSVGRFRFRMEDLPPQLKLIKALLLSLDTAEDPDVEFFVLSSLKILCLHCEALINTRREYRGFLIWIMENHMLSKLWTRLKSDFVQIGEVSALLLLHCISFPAGEDVFWKTVHKDFTNKDWTIRFNSVGYGYVMAHLARVKAVRSHRVLQTALAGLFYHIVVSIYDQSAAVAQRSIIALKALPSNVLKLICSCFEVQFDECIMDRPLIVNAVKILLTQLPDEQTLSFDFFIQRFETLVLEAQLSSQSEEQVFVQDLMHSDPMSDAYQRKLGKARRAIEGVTSARSIARMLKEYNALRHQLFSNLPEPTVTLKHRQHLRRGRRGGGRLSEAALSCRVKILRVVTMVRVVNRWRRERRKAEALGATASLVSLLPLSSEVAASSLTSPAYSSGGYGRLREFTDEESNMCLLFNRVVDMENPERHTVYLVISLFVAFLSNKNSTPTDEKANAKKQSVLFRHFCTLLGYSNTEKCFTIPPARLRKSAVCNAFISGLPEILDANLIIGNQLLPTVVQLLIHLPSPQQLASDQGTTSYSLKLLNQHTRHLWLNSLVLILYKYRFDQTPISDAIVRLIQIVVKTLQAQAHKCSDGDPNTDIATWDDITDEDEENDGLIRPESLTVTTIQESEGENGYETTTIPIRKKSSHRGKKKERVKKKGDNVQMRCGYCNEVKEIFDEETISLCLIAVETFLHREPSMAAPMLFNILHTVTRLIDHPLYPWHQTEVFVTGNSRSVAKQMLRVTLHQLSSSGICFQLFDSHIPRGDTFWNVVAMSLADFPDLSPVYFIQLLLEDLQETWPARLSTIMKNLAAYVVEVPTDMYVSAWNNCSGHLDTFFRKYHTQMTSEGAKPTVVELESAITLMNHVLKVQNYSTFKTSVQLMDAFSRWLAEALHHSPVQLESLLAVCTACNRALIRERDKQSITRAVVAELIQAIKFKCNLHEANYMTIANMILQDAGEEVETVLINGEQYNTAAAEAVRPFLFEMLDFIADLHVLAKIKKETSSDSVGGDLKVRLAEVMASEMSRSNGRDCRTVIRFIPWLMSPPSVTQAAPGAFADSVTNVRVLSWLLLGALHANHACLPVPIECSQHMADYIHFVLAGFADQSKQSVVHMSALFHAFHLCQLWTVYCERAAVYCSASAFPHLLDFWARVTPAILQLLSHSKVLADMVNLHFLNTIQALQQVNSALLCQLYSLWAPILTAYHSQIPNQLRMKLDAGENQPSLQAPVLIDWLKRVRYKISQVELQTSAASPYYNV